MTAPELLWTAPPPGAAAPTVVLAHGAGAPMDSPFMAYFAAALAGAGIVCGRFEFPYMAKTRADGRKGPPDRTEVLEATWRAVIGELDPARLVIGGKSLGGRIASLVADAAGVAGLVCLGYPFHPPGKAGNSRVAHLADLRTPALILQGTRDPFGNREDVGGYALSPAIRVHWLADGDHGFKPPVRSGRSERDNWSEAAAAMIAFAGDAART